MMTINEKNDKSWEKKRTSESPTNKPRENCFQMAVRAGRIKRKSLETIWISRLCLILSIVSACFCTPSGARTLDPNIKSVVLYQLS